MTKTTNALVLTYANPDVTIEWGDLPEASRKYLAQYGLNKALQDAASGTMKAAAEAFNGMDKAAVAYRKRMEGHGVSFEAYSDPTAYAEACALAQKSARLADIMSGEVNLNPSGPRLRGIDAVMFDVAVERLKVAYGQRNMKWPAEAAVVKEMVGKYLAKYGEDARAEAERRMAGTVPVDLGDILGD